MKVTMFTSWQVRCGIANYTADLVQALNDLDDTTVQVAPYDRRPHPRADYRRWGEAMNAGDVAHIQHEYSFFGYLTPWGNHFGALVAPIRRPLVITRHVTFDGPLTIPGRGVLHMVRRIKWSLYNRWLGPYATYLNRDTFAVADQIIVLSARLKAHLVDRGLDAGRIHVIPAGAPAVPQAAGGAELRASWGWGGERVLGIFGYITPAKGHTLAVEALAHLPEDVVLLVAGGVRRRQDQATLAALERQIASLGLQDRVRITGYLEEEQTPAHIDACDLLLYPATHADSSYSLITGIAYRHAAIVASDVFGHREVAERKAGIELFPSGDARALAQTVAALLDSPRRRAELMAEAASYVQRYVWPAVARQTRNVYIEAFAQTNSGRRENK
jgi:glycosyltransferase involved in cell wall biosynthesis